MDRELQKPEFWATHYYLLIADEDRESPDLVEPLFGLSNDAVEAYYFGDLVQPEDKAHPLWLPLRDGYSAGVEHAACDDGRHPAALPANATLGDAGLEPATSCV